MNKINIFNLNGLIGQLEIKIKTKTEVVEEF